MRAYGWMTVLALAASLASGPATPSAPLPSTTAPAAPDRAIEGRMAQSGLVGIGAAIIIDRKLAWSKGYGFADKQRGVPFTPDTVMNIGSISKTVTGVALMQAVQDGKLSLDADINDYLPFKVSNPSFPRVPITLRQLATHTSGITDRWEVYQRLYHWGDDAPEALCDFLQGYLVPGGDDYAKENFLAFKPGTHREYSNIAAGLAGCIIERAVGEKLNVYTRQRIFTPLKMDHSGWFLSEVPAGSHSTLYVYQDGFSVPIPLYGVTTYPDGGVRTSVADLSRFFIALLDGGQYQGARILQPESVAEMLKFQYTQANKPDNVILAEKNSGLFWSTKFNVTRIGHGGSDPGVRTEMLSNLAKDVAIIVFVNTSLAEHDAKAYTALMDDLWKYAEALKRQAGR
ncbi:serine hydrolase domain-containing protein [Lysobacter sp. TAF61]|uniref:serine hydrolase domain-containing protein n=1 Tax=Lysobacter sp. TAF61 TaxID=3233072 RepID=UPI003F952DFD